MSLRAVTRGKARAGRGAALAVVLASLLAMAACKEEASLARYTVRGAVANLTEAQGKPVALIHHEAIPDFVDGYGEKRTMHSMAMAFGVAEGVSLDGVAVGDKLELTFVVDRERYPTFQITSLRELPADTELALSR